MISNSRIDVSLQKGETENFNDERGKKKAGHGFTFERKEKVIQHIKENYVAESSLRGLWNSYSNAYPNDPVSESYYKRKFTFDMKCIVSNFYTDYLQECSTKTLTSRQKE